MAQSKVSSQSWRLLLSAMFALLLSIKLRATDVLASLPVGKQLRPLLLVANKTNRRGDGN